jgi:hypothetical protein
MAETKTQTVEQYIASLDPERRQAISAVRKAVLANLPRGYMESIQFGMISYEIPLARYPKTYNGKPLMYASLASQKNYMSLYLMNVYGDAATEEWFHSRYTASGKRLDMGKSCVRFKKSDDLPLDLIGEVIARTPVEEFIKRYEVARAATKSGR